jgi:hypothetical protein
MGTYANADACVYSTTSKLYVCKFVLFISVQGNDYEIRDSLNYFTISGVVSDVNFIYEPCCI